GGGEAGPLAGGIGSPAFGLDGAGGFCALAGPCTKAKATVIAAKTNLKGDITVLRQVRRSGFASIVAYPSMASGQCAAIRHIKLAKPRQGRKWASSPISLS